MRRACRRGRASEPVAPWARGRGWREWGAEGIKGLLLLLVFVRVRMFSWGAGRRWRWRRRRGGRFAGGALVGCAEVEPVIMGVFAFSGCSQSFGEEQINDKGEMKSNERQWAHSQQSPTSPILCDRLRLKLRLHKISASDSSSRFSAPAAASSREPPPPPMRQAPSRRSAGPSPPSPCQDLSPCNSARSQR